MTDEPPKRRLVRPPTRGGDVERVSAVRLKTAKSRTPSSQAWLERQLNDPFVVEAKAKGYRSRAAFKLTEIDDRFHLLRKGARVVDLFAGAGGLGLEAISRGAKLALFVDDGSEARALLRENIEALGLGGETRIFRRDATKLGAMPPQEPFTLAFLDPPYNQGLAPRALVSLRDGGWLAPDALGLVEEAASAAFDWPEGYDPIETRDYGDTSVRFGRRKPSHAP